MLAHRRQPQKGGSRVAIIMNGSPLFTGDAGSGESEIRRWILEHDLLEALIALPEQGLALMRIISRRMLREFWTRHRGAEQPLIRFVGTHAEYNRVDVTKV